MSEAPASILFLDTRNDAVSLIAEAIADQNHAGDFTVTSAGLDAKDQPHPLAIATLEAQGLATDNLSPKSVESVRNRKYDVVVTLDDASRGSDLQLPGPPPRCHWMLPDPIAAEKPETMFEAVYDVLVEAVGLLAHAPNPSVTGRAKEASRRISSRFSPRAI